MRGMTRKPSQPQLAPHMARKSSMSAPHKLPRAICLEILRLTDTGMSPLQISRKLKIQLPLIFRTLSWRTHMNTHRKAASTLRRQLREHKQAYQKPQRECTVLWQANGPCGRCGKQANNPHIQPGESLNLFCVACCPACSSEATATA